MTLHTSPRKNNRYTITGIVSLLSLAISVCMAALGCIEFICSMLNLVPYIPHVWKSASTLHGITIWTVGSFFEIALLGFLFTKPPH
ncbi:MAG: hypothetical protein JWO43_188 [Candidatus Adlerbacteria bacterium]|nr:hypothetical protein [Candidatus Adlerbacteria bacterium]